MHTSMDFRGQGTHTHTHLIVALWKGVFFDIYKLTLQFLITKIFINNFTPAFR